MIPFVIDTLGTITKGLAKGRGEHRNYRFIEIGLNTEKSPDDLKRLVITQSPAKGHQR